MRTQEPRHREQRAQLAALQVRPCPRDVWVAALLLSVALTWLFPRLRLLPWQLALPTRVALALPFLGLGGYLNFSAKREMAKQGTSPRFGDDIQALVTSGAYRRTRNPIYLAAVMLSVAAAALLNSLWVALAALVWAVHTHLAVVPREEEVRRVAGCMCQGAKV